MKESDSLTMLKVFNLIFVTIFLYSLDFEECAHKLLKMEFPESQTVS